MQVAWMRMPTKAITFIVTATLSLLLFALSGCRQDKPFYTRPLATVSYILWVDLTERDVSADGEYRSSVPHIAQVAAQQVLFVHEKDRGAKILLRGITNKSDDEEFVWDYTFYDSEETAQNDQNIADIPGRVSKWVTEYQKRQRSGFDLCGALDKTARLSEGYPKETKIAAIIVSSMRQAFKPAAKPILFNRTTRVYNYVVNDQANPVRDACEQRVKAAHGQFVRYQSPTALATALQQFRGQGSNTTQATRPTLPTLPTKPTLPRK